MYRNVNVNTKYPPLQWIPIANGTLVTHWILLESLKKPLSLLLEHHIWCAVCFGLAFCLAFLVSLFCFSLQFWLGLLNYLIAYITTFACKHTIELPIWGAYTVSGCLLDDSNKPFRSLCCHLLNIWNFILCMVAQFNQIKFSKWHNLNIKEMAYESITSKPTVNAESIKNYYYPKIRNIFK